MDLLGARPKFNLFNKSWPLRTYHEQYPPIKMVSGRSNSGRVIDSMISGGCVIEGASIVRSVLSSNVSVYDQAEVKNSVLMEGVVIGRNAKIRNAIIDKQVVVPPGTRIGYDAAADKKRFVLTTSGVVIVPKRTAV